MRHALAACGLLASILCLSGGEASANIVFTLDNVLFDDGGQATGFFTTDDSLTSLIDFDIQTTASGGLGFTYTTATANSSSTALPFILVLNTATSDNILQLTFTNLTSTGAPITIGTFDSFEQANTARRDVISGSVVVRTNAIPEPSSLILAGLGGVGLAGLAIRRRRVGA